MGSKELIHAVRGRSASDDALYFSLPEGMKLPCSPRRELGVTLCIPRFLKYGSQPSLAAAALTESSGAAITESKRANDSPSTPTHSAWTRGCDSPLDFRGYSKLSQQQHHAGIYQQQNQNQWRIHPGVSSDPRAGYQSVRRVPHPDRLAIDINKPPPSPDQSQVTPAIEAPLDCISWFY